MKRLSEITWFIIDRIGQKEYKFLWHHTVMVPYKTVPVSRISEITDVTSIVAYLSQSGGCAGWT
jgi:hypothetical protein